jgi:2-hydroxychromene-2-carboxylate isomerase
MGRGLEFVTAYLSCAWAKGVDITSTAGLQRVAAEAGLDWPALQREAEGDDWQPVLEDNVAAMLGAGLWGVPSFRVSGGNDPLPFACWGQDRIWRVEAEILRRAA